MGANIEKMLSTLPQMTRFEKAKVIAYRIQQLEKGSAPLVKINSFNFVEIALEEYKRGKLRHIKVEST